MEALSALQNRMAADPGAVFETVAAEERTTCRAVVEALPAAMRRFAEGADFEAAMADIAGWGEVTFIVHTGDGIFEFSGPVPAGKIARGYFNLGGRSGLHGHLRHDRCAAIAFIERPFMGRASAVVVFLNVDSGIMFKVFVGRDSAGELDAAQLRSFRRLASQLTKESIIAPAG